MLEFLINSHQHQDADDAVRSRRGGRHRLDAGDAAGVRRSARQAHEGGRARARKDPRARTRAHGTGAAEDQSASLGQAIDPGDRRPLQPEEMGRPGRGAAQAGAGRLSRPGALYHLSVLPHGDTGGERAVRRDLSVRGARLQPAGDGQARHVHRRRLCRHASAADVSQEPHRAPPAIDQTRLP